MHIKDRDRNSRSHSSAQAKLMKHGIFCDVNSTLIYGKLVSTV